MAEIGDLIFDGQCGFCTRAVLQLQRLDRKGRIQVHPFQHDGVLAEFGLSAEQTRQAVWFFASSRRLAGAAAVNAALDAALGTRVFLPVYRIPGIRHLQEWVYRWIATHRYRLRGVTPWCVTHPQDCELAVAGASCRIGS